MVGVQISRRELHRYKHLYQTIVEFLYCIKNKITKKNLKLVSYFGCITNDMNIYLYLRPQWLSNNT